MAVVEAEISITARSVVKIGPLPFQMAEVVTPGVGKTETLLRVMAGLADKLADKRIHVFTPDNTLTGELLERARSILPASLKVRVHRGRTDTKLGDALCHPEMHEKADQIQELGGSVADMLCPVCPHREGCGWLAQKADKAPGVVIMPNNYLVHDVGGACDAAVVDEEFISRLVRTAEVDFPRMTEHDTLPDLPDWERGWTLGSLTRIYAQSGLKDARRRLAGAFSGGVPTLSKLRSAGVTAALAEHAKGIEYGRYEGVKSLLAKAVKEGQDIAQATADARARFGEARKYASVWRVLQTQLSDDARDTLNGFTLKGDTLRVGYRKKTKVADKPVLALDATGDARLFLLAMPTLTRVDEYAVDTQHTRVIQVTDAKNSKSALVDMETDGPRVLKEKAARRQKVVEIAEALAGPEKKKVGLISYKGVVESEQVADAPAHIVPGHFGLLRGQNKWEDVDILIIAGRPLPDSAGVEEIAGGLFFDQPEVVNSGGIGTTGRFYMLRGGGVLEGLAEEHTDPLVEKVRRQVTEAELIQAIGRGRGVRREASNPLVVVLLTLTPVPGVLVDELVKMQDIEPDKIDMIWSREGVFLENYADAFEAFPGGFASKEDARSAMRRDRRSASNAYMNIYRELTQSSYPQAADTTVPNGAVPTSPNNTVSQSFNIEHMVVEYQRSGPGNKKRRALFYLAMVPDPRKWLEHRFGVLAKFEITEHPRTPVCARKR